MAESERLMRDVEMGEDSPTSKKHVGSKLEKTFPLTRWEFSMALGVFLVFSIGLFFIYQTMPAADGQLKLPRSISDLRILKYVPKFLLFCFITILTIADLNVVAWNYTCTRISYGFFLSVSW